MCVGNETEQAHISGKRREFRLFQDKTLSCRDCGSDFVFTAGEQKFYDEKGFNNEPSRCPTCRSENKRRRSGRKEMHDAICAECGCETQVPFRPTEGRPVYCRDCYRIKQ